MSRHYDYALMSDFVYKLGDDKYKNNLEYKNQESELSSRGWKCISTSQRYNIGAGVNYFGAAFEHTKTSEIVIAHRGSILNDKDISNVIAAFAIMNGKIPEFILEPCFDYVAVVLKEYPGKKITMTGHSLGGYLAGACAISLKIGNLNVKAITFDSLGTDVFLERVKNDFEGIKSILQIRGVADSFGDIQISRLDEINEKIVNYLSSPNLVNTSTGHIGKKRRIFASDDMTVNVRQKFLTSHNELKELRQADISLGKKSLDREIIFELTLDVVTTLLCSHRMANLLSAFDKNTGDAFKYGNIKCWPTKGTSFFYREEQYEIIHSKTKRMILEVFKEIIKEVAPLVISISNSMAAKEGTEDQNKNINKDASRRLQM